MNKSAFLHVIRQPSSISAGEAEELEELVVNFPYCQTAHLLIAKAAYDRGSMLANQKLKKAAAYATNRQLLRKLVYAPTPAIPLQEEVPAALLPEPQPTQIAGPLVEEVLVEEPVANGHDIEEVESSIGDFEVVATSDLQEVETEWVPVEAPATETEDPIEEAAEGSEEALMEAPLLLALKSEPAGPVELPDDLDGLLFIDRIFPFRQGMPEHLPAPTNLHPIDHSVAETQSAFTVGDTEAEANTPDALEDPASDPALIALLLQPTGATPSDEATIAAEAPPITLEGWLAEEPLDWNDLETAPIVEEEAVQAPQLGEAEAPTTPLTEASTEEELAPKEELTPELPISKDIFASIYAQNQLGYAMGSSRLGECLEVKHELTSSRPVHFYPDLILEYLQEHEMEVQEPAPVDSVLDHQISLIDQFLKLSPRLKQFGDARLRAEPQEDLSFKSSKIKKSIASENLATIFLKQGKVKKAIKIYEHLITKFPEKKAYFADQIEKLKPLT